MSNAELLYTLNKLKEAQRYMRQHPFSIEAICHADQVADQIDEIERELKSNV